MGKRADNKAITPYTDSWAERIGIDPLPKPKDHFEDAVTLRKEFTPRQCQRCNFPDSERGAQGVRICAQCGIVWKGEF